MIKASQTSITNQASSAKNPNLLQGEQGSASGELPVESKVKKSEFNNKKQLIEKYASKQLAEQQSQTKSLINSNQKD